MFTDPWGTNPNAAYPEKDDPTSGNGSGYSNEQIADVVNLAEGVADLGIPGYNFAKLMIMVQNKKRVSSMAIILAAIDVPGGGKLLKGIVSKLVSGIAPAVLRRIVKSRHLVKKKALKEAIENYLKRFDKADDLLEAAADAKNAGKYAPDAPLPRNADGVAVPDSSYPHTQLGTKHGRKGKYTQARTWVNKDGKLVKAKDIDFTDHGRALNHTNPHQHRWIPNETGGALKHGKAEPFDISEPLQGLENAEW